jgi:hypothetical protein
VEIKRFALKRDALHTVLCAAGYNLRWLLRAIVRLGIAAVFFACKFWSPCSLDGMPLALRRPHSWRRPGRDRDRRSPSSPTIAQPHQNEFRRPDSVLGRQSDISTLP